MADNGEPVQTGVVECALCGGDDARALLHRMFECDEHVVHAQCQLARGIAEPCPTCQAAGPISARRLGRLVAIWTRHAKIQLLASLVVMALMVPLYAACKVYTLRVERLYSQVRAVRDQDDYWRSVVHEPTLATAPYIAAAVVQKCCFLAIGLLVGWNIKSFLNFWNFA